MTEEQTKFLYSIADNMGTTGIEDFTDKDGEKMREIIKALEQSTSDDCVSRKFIYELGATCIATRDKNDKLIALGTIDELPSVTPTIPSSDDCVSRQAVLEMIEQIQNAGGFIGYNTYSEAFDQVDNMPSVTPTHCIAAVRFSKEDLREICNERIEIECTHGTCKDCKNNRKNPYARKQYTCELGNRYKLRDCDNFYCADFEKRGGEDE